jgi:hypothetical protein
VWLVTRFVRHACFTAAFSDRENDDSSMWCRPCSPVLEVGEKAVDVGLREFARMTLPVELDEPSDPVDVGLFRTAAVMADAENLDDAVVEPGRRSAGEQAQRRSVVWSGGCHRTHLAMKPEKRHGNH